ncbi:MAG: hypothetical protein RSH07_02445, partial [Comamonas sp.]
PTSPAPVNMATQTVAVAEVKKPVLAGCIRSATRCNCYDETGEPMATEPGTCELKTVIPSNPLAGGGVDWYPDPRPPAKAPDPRWTGTVVGTQKGWQF